MYESKRKFHIPGNIDRPNRTIPEVALWPTRTWCSQSLSTQKLKGVGKFGPETYLRIRQHCDLCHLDPLQIY